MPYTVLVLQRILVINVFVMHMSTLNCLLLAPIKCNLFETHLTTVYCNTFRLSYGLSVKIVLQDCNQFEIGGTLNH